LTVDPLARPERGDARPPQDARTAELRAAVLAWVELAGRDLPWRHTRDPWAVLVSEVMLAQTQVARVGPKWEAFMARWPDPAACAAAPLAQVIAAWTGLGYNRRAVYLHRAAGDICGRHGGSVPSDLAALMALPGVGPYTARAVLAFAFEQPVGVVDTNAARVLARAVEGRPLALREAQALADGLVPPAAGWVWNQAMLDLGAVACRARRPLCGSCPLGPRLSDPAGAGLCAWARAGGPDPAAGSAATSRPQAAFSGSDRQGRGRILASLIVGRPQPAGGRRLDPEAIAAAAGWADNPRRAMVVAQTLIDDGLVVGDADGSIRLP
jgi:A/G-specific adenine glycosylase